MRGDAKMNEWTELQNLLSGVCITAQEDRLFGGSQLQKHLQQALCTNS
jgi:hypothetical protein